MFWAGTKSVNNYIDVEPTVCKQGRRVNNIPQCEQYYALTWIQGCMYSCSRYLVLMHIAHYTPSRDPSIWTTESAMSLDAYLQYQS